MTLIIEKDYGTPEKKSEKTVELSIDGNKVSVPEGTSVMRAAREIDVEIPSLCASDCMKEYGSCRLCLVEIDGVRGTPASCTTPAAQDMEVKTTSDRLTKIRRGIMELYISDHPDDDSPLHDMAKLVGLKENRYGKEGHNHLKSIIDDSNPYFSFDPAKCILCSRCVRACEEVQGTFALTVDGRGFDSKISAGADQTFLASDCVSCGACVQACPTDSLFEKRTAEIGKPDHSVVTTCAYCGVGCGFKAELKNDEVVRMMPWKDGMANHGHSCVKGRFAWDYAIHEDRILSPMIRDDIKDAWKKVGWDEAIDFAAKRLMDIQEKHGKKSIGGITSSRCTNEEVFVVQKLIRAAFQNNNVDTCARVCHSPTGYGLGQTLGTSAGTQTFDSVMDTDVMMVIGANPTDAHPVFASQMKRRLREGAKLIVIDPRKTGLVKSPHIKADYHLPLLPGTNVSMINAIAHVVITEGLMDQDYIDERCEQEAFNDWANFIKDPINSPETAEQHTGVPAEDIRAAARLYATGGNSAIYYGLGVTEHSQGSTMVIGMANLAMATGNIGASGVGVNPLRGQNNVQGSCDMGSFPHELPGYRAVTDDVVRSEFEKVWGVTLDPEPGYRIPNMFDAAVEGKYKAMFVQGEDVAQSDPNTHHVEAALNNLECLIVQDLFLNETARFAHVFFPGTSFLEKNGTFTNAERRISRVRKTMEPMTGMDEWEVSCRLGRAMGYDLSYNNASEIMDEIALLTPTFTNVSFDMIDERGSVQWPCNEKAPEGTPIMHIDRFVRGKGNFIITEYVPTTERTTRKFPLILTTGRILSQYNVGAQTRRTKNNVWHSKDILDIHPHDAENRGIVNGDMVLIQSRMGETVLEANITENMQPGVVYTTFHMPESGANIITTDNSDWATDCPEYKVTAVEVRQTNKKSDWQEDFDDFSSSTRHIAE
ncbi:MAG: formate dehydrogenase subunit alpha [Kordiimonadaceae bacterium]|jgi:formate dehydrogenase major subunit|nr:formate dehydrogenase subunit alpha [Kordiimonadaceae bacterium]MBT6036185.1 formate dehydrogenase subunit alpha [Kordiimonadaceae bacterium]MBT6329038.1 formate dehydrogenase subunit alpha [Kordiimonadaceae bacterium]